MVRGITGGREMSPHQAVDMVMSCGAPCEGETEH